MKVLILTAVLIATAAFVEAPLKDIELKWKATTAMSEFSKLDLTKLSEHKIKITDLKDNRKAPLSRVGVNLEKENTEIPVDTKSTVADFVTDNLTSVLQKAGLEIVKSGEGLTLSGEITDFMVTETNTYKGNLTMRLQISKGGKIIWKGVISGSNTRFGRSYKLDNYLETLSDTIVDAVLNLVQNEGLKNKIR